MKVILHLPTGLLIKKYIGVANKFFYDLDKLTQQNPYRYAKQANARFKSKEEALAECNNLVIIANAGYSLILPKNISINEFIVVDEDTLISDNGK